MIKIYKIDTLTNIVSIDVDKYNHKDIAMIAYICWKLDSKVCLAQNKSLIVKGYTNIIVNGDCNKLGLNFSYLVLENPHKKFSIQDVYHISSYKNLYFLYDAIKLAIENKKEVYSINSYPTIIELINFAIGFIKDNYGRDYNEYIYRYSTFIQEMKHKAIRGKDPSTIDSSIFNFDDTAFRYDLIDKERTV